jgi:LuxR family transcriptional regulator, maltose regulon positive regulatory protein
MVVHTSATVKFNRPSTKGVVLRENLFKTLKQLSGTPVIYVQGPAGAGKTALISSYLECFKIPCLWYKLDEGDRDPASFFYYLRQAVKSVHPENKKSQIPLLTPEYLKSIPLFTRLFFQQLFTEIRLQRVLVFDNFQAIADRTEFQKAFANGLKVIPPEKQMMIISRKAPPSIFARLKAHSNIAVLNWDELRLSLDESRQIAGLRGYDHLTGDQIALIHKKCEGWATGLILVLKVDPLHLSKPISHSAKNLLDDIFNYFAGEVFEDLEPEIQNLLLRTAYMPNLHARHAAQLTANPNAEALLAELSKNQYFVTPYSDEEPVYHYHQLFRQFLISEAEKNLDLDLRIAIQNNSAHLLLESGNIEDAASLFIVSENWQSLIDVIVSNAENLIEKGRHETLFTWINSLPRVKRAGLPWLSYWLGVCQLIKDPEIARRHFIKAFERFKQRQNAIGIYSAWSSIIDTFIYAWGNMKAMDRWISELQPLLNQYPISEGPVKDKIASAMFCALIYRQPQHPDIGLWEERVRHIILHAEDAQLKIMLSSHLILYYTWWIGAQEKAAFLADIIQIDLKEKKVAPLHYIVWRSIEGASLWMRNRFAESHAALIDGLETSENNGIHLWDFMLLANMVYLHLCRRKLDDADYYLHRMRFILKTRRKMDISQYHSLNAYARLCKGNLGRALEHIDAAIELADTSGWPFPYHFYLTEKADILIESGEYDQAEDLLDTAFKFGRLVESSNLIYKSSWLRALIHYKLGNKEKTEYYLRMYLKNSIINSTVNHAYWRSDVMAPLFIEALKHGIEVDHIKRLIGEHGMIPPKNCQIPENWPFKVRIYTLGHFSLVVDDQPIPTETKRKNKPLEMLKALVACVGHEISDDTISDCLWPDTDGDRALQNFTVTLHRLRKLIGHPGIIILKDHKVCLNSDLCWVDIWALQRLFGDLDHILTHQNIPEGKLLTLAEKLQLMYKGFFLNGDQEPWAIRKRHQIHNRWTHIVRQLVVQLEDHRRCSSALQLYRHTLKIDPTAEWACRGAMRCGIELREFDDAWTSYERFKTACQQTYDHSPSPQTEALRKKLQLLTQVNNH